MVVREALYRLAVDFAVWGQRERDDAHGTRRAARETSYSHREEKEVAASKKCRAARLVGR